MEYKYQTYYYHLTIGDYVIEFYRNHNIEGLKVTTKPIGNVVTGVTLNMQGEQNDVDSPITKTSVSIGLINASDIKDNQMNGAWDFFAKAGEKEWEIKVLRESDDVYVWSGFITPDSYSEQVEYRGGCSITARDNIGQLQNYDFDAEGDADGMISMRDLVNAAWAKIGTSMQLEWCADDIWMASEDGRNAAPDTLMNISAFEEMSWYEALESVLYSYGAVLRFTGLDSFIVVPLSALPTLGKFYSRMSFIQPTFVAGLTREFSPSVKQIEEQITYDIEEKKDFVAIGGFLGEVKTYPCEVESVQSTGEVLPTTSTGYIHPITGNSTKGWANTLTSSLFFDCSKYAVDSYIQRNGLEQTIKSLQYIAANNTDSRYVVYGQSVDVSDFAITMKLGTPIGVNSFGQIAIAPTTNLRKIRYCLAVTNSEQGSAVYYYRGNGVWSTGYYEIEQEYDYTTPTKEIKIDARGTSALSSGLSKVEFKILKLEFVKSGMDYNGVGYNYSGLYAAIESITFDRLVNMPVCSKSNIITKYDESNSLILSRSPKFAPAVDRVLFPSYIKNGIFERIDGQIVPIRSWMIFNLNAGLYSQFAAGVHLQLIPYYSQCNEVLNGTIINAPKDFIYTIWLWGDLQEHILISGNLNLENGHIEGAVLREFARYSDIWQGATIPEFKEESIRK